MSLTYRCLIFKSFLKKRKSGKAVLALFLQQIITHMVAVSLRFRVILRGVFVFYTPGGLCRKRRHWSKFCIIEEIVVSYTSKVEIPVSRYL